MNFWVALIIIICGSGTIIANGLIIYYSCRTKRAMDAITRARQDMAYYG